MSRLVVTDGDGTEVAWEPGRPSRMPDPSLVRLSMSDRPECSVDIFGFPPQGLARVVPVRTELHFVLDLLAEDCPLGPAFTRLHISGTGRMAGHPLTVGSPEARAPEAGVEHEPMIIVAPYRLLLRWLHRDAIFGHLMYFGADIRGDLLDYAALDGIVSAPAVSFDGSTVVDFLIDLARG